MRSVRVALAALSMLGCATRALADDPRNSQITQPNWPKARQADEPSNACPEVGPGYIKVPGTASCLKVGGRVQVEAGTVRR